MHVRVIDYAGYRGGVNRFTVQTLKALTRLHPEARFEVVSHGAALERYRERLATEGIPASATEIALPGSWREHRLPESEKIGQVLGNLIRARWQYEVPAAAFEGCDVAWLPNIQRHRASGGKVGRAVATLHDLIPFQVRGLWSTRVLGEERRSLVGWLESPARVVADSEATRSAAEGVLGAPPGRVSVVPLATEDARTVVSDGALPWDWSERPFLLYPASIVRHKNHEVLLDALARWGAKHPLVLTGWGVSKLYMYVPGTRGSWLRRFARARGLRFGEDWIPLGYVSNEQMNALLGRAWALAMPTLAEGFGLPVIEAMAHGVPVLCSDIPVLREQVERAGGEVLWFDPRDAEDLAARLRELEADYPTYKNRAAAQVGEMRLRSWDDVAADYWRVFESTAGGAAG